MGDDRLLVLRIMCYFVVVVRTVEDAVLLLLVLQLISFVNKH